MLWVSVLRPGPLSLPYFWDEADVYVPGSMWVAENNLDVTPGIFPDDYSRGHPPLLFLIAGVAFRLFGPSPVVGHLVVLPFAVLALAGTYLLGAMLFGRQAGVAAALLLGVTPLFLSIGNMLLPEIPLTGLTVLALVMFARGRILGAALCGVALVLLKETGVFTAGAIAGAVLFDGWRRGAGVKRFLSRPMLRRFGLSLLPVAVLCGFFVWQRLCPAGYFVFPHHQNLLWERPLGWSDLATIWPSLLFWHGRWIVVGSAAILGVVLAIRRRASTPESNRPWRPLPSTVVAAMVLLVVENAVFFTKMFWLERYALPAHPGVLVLASGALIAGLPSLRQGTLWQLVPWAPILAACVLGLLGLHGQTRPNEEELTFAYTDVINTHRRAFERLDQVIEGAPVVLTAWPMTIELRDPRLGYVNAPVRTIHVDSFSDESSGSINAILVPSRSCHAAPLRRHAQRLRMRRIPLDPVGTASPLELYVR